MTEIPQAEFPGQSQPAPVELEGPPTVAGCGLYCPCSAGSSPLLHPPRCGQVGLGEQQEQECGQATACYPTPPTPAPGPGLGTHCPWAVAGLGVNHTSRRKFSQNLDFAGLKSLQT